MPNLNEAARRIIEDAQHSAFKLGAKSTSRLVFLIEAMAADIETLKADARERRAGYPGYES